MVEVLECQAKDLLLHLRGSQKHWMCGKGSGQVGYLLQCKRSSPYIVGKITTYGHRVNVLRICPGHSRNGLALLPNVWGFSWKLKISGDFMAEAGIIGKFVYSYVCSGYWLSAKILAVSVCQNTYSWPLHRPGFLITWGPGSKD